MKIKIFIALIITSVFLLGTGSCKYHKLKKSKDHDLKTNAAHDFYDNGKFAKAIPLYEDVILMKRNTQGYEKILFQFANSYFNVKDYILAGYYFRKFTDAFPKSVLAEQAQFNSAYCYYLDAPKSTLDQQATYIAMQEFGVFLSKYPESEKIAECNELIDELRSRLEKKAFENARLYYYTERYNAAVVSLNNTLVTFPDTQYEEETLFLILKSGFLYAEKSISAKQEERYEEANAAYEKFVSKFPASEFLKEAERMNKKIIEELNKIKSV